MRRRKTWQRQAAAITAAMMAMSVGGIAYAMPQGEVIRSGKGEITRQDKDMTVNQDSKRLAIDWAGFDIANDERVTFRQPDRDSVALNRVVGDAASVIDGALSGNGHVYVINPNGVLFGKNASVDVGSLVASTARISDRDMTNFAGADGITMAIPEDSSAKVINAGTIRAEGGLVVLHAAEVENSGTITNPEGTTALAAARNLSLSADTAGKINFTVDGALAKAKALNSGMLKADGGYLVMTARSAGDVMSTVVNNTGTMEAKTLRQNEKGEILLDGGDNGIVELNGTLDASGMEAGQSAGSIKAIGAETHVEDGATLHAIGAVDGGLIETSGDYLEIGDNVDIDAAGKTGKAGEWLLDPLEVVISDSQPTGSSSVTNGNKDGSYNSSNNASGTASRNKTTWVNSNTVNRLLNNGTAVSVQATDANKVASITLDSAINKTSGKDTSLTLEAQRNVTVNKEIKSTSGALNVNLHSDTDGDGLGAVLINADIATNGGTFKSVSGTTIDSGSVGTYFGNQGKMGDRHVTTNGGAINLYGDVAIGLNGGTLTLDTKNKTTGASGAVKVTGTVDSGNSYKRVASGLEGWTDFVKSYYDDVIRKDKSSSYRYTKTTTTTTYKATGDKSRATWWDWEPRYLIDENGSLIQVNAGEDGYLWSQINAHTETTTKVLSYDELNASQKSNLSSHLAAQSITWAGAKAMAQGATNGTNNTGDTYLATITTALENSLASPPEEYQLIVGGRGSGSTRNPADPDHPYGYYWVTGPEGMANNGKGTKFAKNDGSAVNNYYVKWNYSYSQDTKQTEKEPNNSGPIVSIGFGTASNWDDVKEGAGTIRGFVQEKNLEHSGLVINAGDSQVDIAGNIGNSVALKNVEINAGDVAIGSGSHYTGIVHTDEGVSITGKNVTVGDRITADTKGVDIQATGDIDVDGITAHENINLTTTGESSAIVLNRTHNDGALITKSTDNDAVIIDARGTDGSFKNLTTAENAITTGKDGNWKVYSASPDRDTFGTNLKSETTACWHASSQRGNGLDKYDKTENTNKYIFQVQPTITVKADDQTKTYGDTADVSNYTTTATASFTGRNGEYSVSDERFRPAFQEGNLKDRYTGKIMLSSEGAVKEKTRMEGNIDKTSSDNARPYFFINAEGQDLAGKEGYAVTTANGTLEILRRDANISGTGTQTYGNSNISWTTTASNLKNNDQVGTVTIKEGSDYTEKQQGRTTADAGTYENSAAFGSILNEKGEDVSINYNLTGTGTIEVNPATLTVYTKDIRKTYGNVDGVKNALLNDYYVTGEANGDSNEDLRDSVTLTNTSDAIVKKNGVDRTADASTEGYAINTSNASTSNSNYRLVLGDAGKVYLDKANLTIKTNGFEKVYGDVNGVQEALENAATITGLTNGDGPAEMTVNGTSDALRNVNGEIRTNDVKVGGYDVNADLSSLSKELQSSINRNYNINPETNKLGIGILNRRNIKFITDDVNTTYGDGNTIRDKVNNGLLHLEGLVTWDKESDVLAELSPEVSVDTTNKKQSPYKIVDGKPATDGKDNLYTNDATDEGKGYSITSLHYNVAKNYNVTSTKEGHVNIAKAKLQVRVGNVRTTYGTAFDTSKYTYSYADGIVNGDTAESLNASLSSKLGLLSGQYVNTAARDGEDGIWTADAGDGYTISLKSKNGKNFFDYYLKNYDTEVLAGNAKVEKANLVVNVGNAETVYGTPFDENEYGYAYSTETGKKLVNGDTKESLATGLGTIKYYNDAALDGTTTGRWTKDVGNNYLLTFTDGTKGAFNALNNYNVSFVDGKAKVTQFKIDKDNYKDYISGATYTTKYGSQDEFGTATFQGINGDKAITLEITDSSALLHGKDGRTTDDAAENKYTTVVSLGNLTDEARKNYDLEGTASFTFDNSATVKKADLVVNVGNAETVYGTPFDESKYNYAYSTETGKKLVNGDTKESLATGLGTIKYYNDAALDGTTTGRWTKDVGNNYLLTFTDGTKGAFNALNNYNVSFVDGKAKVTQFKIDKDNYKDYISGATYTTKYGSQDEFGTATFQGINGDKAITLEITDSSALLHGKDGRTTDDAAENKYTTVVSLGNLTDEARKNYDLEGTASFTFDNSATVKKADLVVNVGNAETVYGTPFDESKYNYAYSTETGKKLVNGDTKESLATGLGKIKYYNDAALDGTTTGRWTKSVGDNYLLTFTDGTKGAFNALNNYNVSFTDGKAKVTPYTLTEENIVNPDGSPLYTTKYGQKDAFGTATFTGVNGDGTYELAITDSSALATAGAGKVTQDVGKNIYNTTVELSEAMNGNYQFADGATSKTFEKTASVTPAELTIKTKDVETEYGTVKTTTSEVEGLVNGDLPTGFIYDYGNYGGAYLDGNTKTNDVNTYHFGTMLSGAEFLKNYTITGGEADVKIDPKDVTFFVSGTGNTLTDVTYTVDPDIDAQLAYGEHVDADYTPGNTLGDNQYGVVAHINGTPIISGNVAGNYRYNYEGLITLSPTVPTKPDIDPHNPSNLDGSGSWTSNMGNHGVPGVERVAGLASAELPFFKVEAGQVSHYGTYDVAADPDKVRLEPTGKRLPEPNQPKTQYREYTKALTTTDGTGMFRMVYDGSTFNITPVDDGALALMRMGDVKNNVELSAEALHAGFSEMGILLEDLDGVYVHFDTMA
nr:filamentous hemagglutinin N-terminal domain-containing protein [Mitsuokella multacida]